MAVDPDQLREELARMRELIANDPKVLAHFDLDGNGVIDGDEWENVRKLVERRLERRAQEAEESARLAAEYEAELAAEQVPEVAPTAGRDFSNLELAFDPREQHRGEVAESIYKQDLHQRVSPQSVRTSEDHTLGGLSELVLEQAGGARQLFGSVFRRSYDIKSADGEVVGHISQRQNEMLENLSADVSIFDLPDIEFMVDDYLADEQFRFTRSRGFSDNSITVTNPRGRTIATTSWSLSFVRRKYEIRATGDGVSYYVRRKLFRPWTFDALDPFEEFGELQRDWTGFGFLGGANLFHIALDKPVSSAAMWGFLATALLADLDGERNSRGSFLSG